MSSKRLTKHRIVGYTGGGDYSNNHWPHPINQEFNNIVRSIVKIYGTGPKEEAKTLRDCRNYLISRIKGLIDHKIRRDTEEYYRVMDLKIEHGFNKDRNDRQKLVSECDLLLCVGSWRNDEDSLEEYRYAKTLGKPIYEMFHDPLIPTGSIERFLEPIRPITVSEWDDSKKDDILIYEDEDGSLELMDGNHRHEFATRLGTVPYLSGWIIRKV